MYVCESLLRLAFSILVRLLLENVTNINEGHNLRNAYLLSLLVGIVWALGAIAINSGFY